MGDYITPADLDSQLTDAEIVQLTDDHKTGTRDPEIIDKAILASEAEVNGYLATKYMVPITPAPELVKNMTLDLFVYRLYLRRKRVPETIRQAYEDATKKLEQIAKGVITLGVDPIPAASDLASDAAFWTSPRIFSRDTLRSF